MSDSGSIITTLTGFDIFMANLYRAMTGREPHHHLASAPRYSPPPANRRQYTKHEPLYSNEFHDTILQMDVDRPWLL